MGKEIRLTPGLSITFDVVSVQRHKRIWGDNAQQFDPLRWRVKSDDADIEHHTVDINGNASKPLEPGEDHLEDEKRTHESVNHTSKNLFKPPKGSFIPFSEGARACLGMDQYWFAKVRFTLTQIVCRTEICLGRDCCHASCIV